jgi:hypothetical protein
MRTERLTALATTAANNHGVVIALKREERPLPLVGPGALCREVQKMTVSEFGNLVISRGIMPSAILAESGLQREPLRLLA